MEGAATLLTFVLFLVTYWSRSTGIYSELLMQAMFLLGAGVLCGIVVYGVLVRHFLPFISHMIVVGACMIGLSRITALLAELPAFQRFPIIGPEGWGYMLHHDDMLLYPGFILMLGGFYLSILHAAKMRSRLVQEATEKEAALRRSEEVAASLARRVAIENLATTISSRFINLGVPEIGPEIDDSLAELGPFLGVERIHISFVSPALAADEAHFCWAAPDGGPATSAASPSEFMEIAWVQEVMGRGELIGVHRLADLPPEGEALKARLSQMGIQSLLMVPLMSDHALHGYIGFETLTAELEWGAETEPLVRMIGEILLSAWERRCAEHQRRLLESQVEQARKLESLGVMAGGIAHDFNNLLTGIMGNAELAQLEAEAGSSSHRYLESVVQSSRRAAELCRQMLAYAGRGKFVTESFRLDHLIEEMEPLLRTSLTERNELEIVTSEAIPTIQGDVGQFRQVISNLVSNAVEALGEEAGHIAIRTGTRYCDTELLASTYLPAPLPAGKYVYLEVEDNGSGMTQEVQQKMFEPFFTTRFAGRGLGLPAVLGIVRSHRGAIDIESASGAGTTIRLYLPVDTVASATQFVEGAPQGDWHGRGTVLLADDEDLVLSVGSRMLQHLGLNVVTARDGNEVLSHLDDCIDGLQCIILDFEMPGTDISGLCRELSKALPDVPVVIASGHARELVAEQIESDDVAAILSKPFELAGLQEMLREFLIPASTSDEA